MRVKSASLISILAILLRSQSLQPENPSFTRNISNVSMVRRRCSFMIVSYLSRVESRNLTGGQHWPDATGPRRSQFHLFLNRHQPEERLDSGFLNHLQPRSIFKKIIAVCTIEKNSYTFLLHLAYQPATNEFLANLAALFTVFHEISVLQRIQMNISESRPAIEMICDNFFSSNYRAPC